MREAILMAIRRSVSRIIIQSDSQLVVNAINGKIGALKDIINLVADIKFFLTCFSECRLEYYNGAIKTDVDVLAKMIHV